jgi:acyl carrier protein
MQPKKDTGKPMSTPSQAIVHASLATHLGIEEALIEDPARLDDLGLDPLDLVLVVVRLENLDRGAGDFPVAALEHAKTVGDLVTLVELWWQRERAPMPAHFPNASAELAGSIG